VLTLHCGARTPRPRFSWRRRACAREVFGFPNWPRASPRWFLEQRFFASPFRRPLRIHYRRPAQFSWLPGRPDAFRRSRRDHRCAGRALSVGVCRLAGEDCAKKLLLGAINFSLTAASEVPKSPEQRRFELAACGRLTNAAKARGPPRRQLTAGLTVPPPSI